MGWWQEIFHTRAKDWIFNRLADDQIPDQAKSSEVNPEQAYVTVTLRSLRVVNVRSGLHKFFGAVHSVTSVPHLSGQKASFHVVTTPSNLRDVDAARIDRVIPLDQPLLGPVPYRGGPLEMEIGLFSVRSADLAAPYLSLLEKMASVSGVSFITTALPFVEPLREGIRLLTGSDDASILEIGVAATQDVPRTGWYLAMRAPKDQVDPSNFRIDPNDNRVLGPDGTPVKDYPYLVFSISASSQRPDWFVIPELIGPYGDLQKAVREGEADAARDALGYFRRVARTSPDLLRDDAKRLVSLVTEDVNDVLGPTPTGAKELVLRDLKDVPLYESV